MESTENRDLRRLGLVFGFRRTVPQAARVHMIRSISTAILGPGGVEAVGEFDDRTISVRVKSRAELDTLATVANGWSDVRPGVHVMLDACAE